MPTKRFDNVEPEKQKRILDAACREFVAHGFENALLNVIVKEADISKGSLYYYFEDKLDLFLAVCDRHTKDIFAEIGGVDPGEYSDDFWADVEAHTRRLLEFTLSNPEILVLLREIIYLGRSPHAGTAVRELYEEWKDHFAGFVRKGQEMGAVRTDLPFDIIVDVLFYLGEVMDSWLSRYWDEKPVEELYKTALLFIDMMKRVAKPSPENGGGWV